MAKQLNVNLAFTADTSKAKAQLLDLLNLLSRILQSSSGKLGILSEIESTIRSVAELLTHLNLAVNTNTGNLDFSKLNDSVKRSGMSLTEYGKKLLSLGPLGELAFLALTRSVLNAEVPLRRTNALFSNLFTTLKNTARWQLSSSILHGFMGTVQSAYGYAQDLNKSLNNIRIVTGYNVDLMSKFADEANKAAKALSTTTTSYTNASLIYYQLGLNDLEVKARTDVTIKMANVARESAETVSEQMTAVWNNFYDGSKSLEYYADVMTALGAATASSTSEISQGLEKFAAVADTVGLSYEYATAALATVTATTRQSADVVGTAFKTLFARIQDLELGKTLDDGVTLGKYSKALNAVGVNILDASGNLMKMDDILDAMAGKWDTLTKALQTSLAQTVAGTRLYTQLVALMENWDFMQQNLGVVADSSGALQKQLDIYSEGWEAASKRVLAALLSIYETLLDDQGFINLLNTIEKIISMVDVFIDTLGGLTGVLTFIGTLITRIFSLLLAQGLTNAAYGIKMLTAAGRQQAADEKKKFVNTALNSITHEDGDTPEDTARKNVLEKELELLQQYYDKVEQMNLTEKSTNLILMDRTKLLGEKKIEATKNLEEAKERRSDAIFNARVAALAKGSNMNDFTKAQNQILRGSKAEETIDNIRKKGISGTKAKTLLLNMASDTGLVIKGNKQQDLALTNYVKSFNDVDWKGQKLEETLAKIKAKIIEIKNEGKEKLINLSGEEEAEAVAEAIDDVSDKTRESSEANQEFLQSVEGTSQSIKASKGIQKSWADNAVSLSTAIMGVTSALSILGGVMNTVMDPDTSGLEKVGSVLMGLGSIIPMLIMAFNEQTKAALISFSASIKSALGITASGAAAAGATPGFIGLAGAIWSVTWPILAVMAAIGLLIAAIAGIAYAIDKAKDAYNADAIAAEKAEEAAKNLAEAYSTAKEEYESMIEAFDKYHTALDSLDKLTRGTKEYLEALKESNRLALELINTYNLIQGLDYEWTKDGILKIYEAAEEKIKLEEEDKLNLAYATSLMSDVYARLARNKANQTNITRLILDKQGVGDSDIFWKTVADTAAVAGLSLIPGAGLVAGTASAVGAVAHRESLKHEALQYEDYIDKAVSLGKEDESIFDSKLNLAKELGLDENSEIVLALYNNSKELSNLSGELVATENAIKVASENSARELLSDNELVLNAYDAEDILKASGGIYQTLYDEAYNTALNNAKNRGWFNTGTDKAKLSMKEYAELTGLDKLSGYKVTNYTGDGTVKYEYLENGEKIKKEVSAEEIAAALATAEAEKTLGNEVENLITLFRELDSTGKEADLALKTFISAADLESTTKTETDELYASVSGKDNVVSTDDAKTYLSSKLGDDLEAYAIRAGYDTADEYIEAFAEELNNNHTAWESFELLPSSILDNPNITLGSALLIENTLKNINFGPLGEKGGEDYLAGLNKILNGISEKDLAKFFEKFSKINWSDWNAGEQVKDILNELGYALNYTEEEWSEFIETMRVANMANFVSEFERLKETLLDVANIVKDGINLGDLISDKDYLKIINANAALLDLFALTASGKYAYIGNSILDYGDFNIDETLADMQELQDLYNKFSNMPGKYWSKVDFLAIDTEAEYDSILNNWLLDSEEKTESDHIVFDVLEKLGYSEDRIKEIAATGTLEQKEFLFNALKNFLSQGKSGAYSLEAQELILATAAKTIEELKTLLNEGQISEETFDKALEFVTKTEAEDLGFDYKEVKAYADALEQLPFVTTREEANKLALANKKLNSGLLTLIKGWDKWEEKLNSKDLSDPAYLAAINKIKKAISNMLNVDEVDNTFIIKHMDKIKEAAEGNVNAIEFLRREHANSLVEATEAEGIEIDKLKTALAEFNMELPIGVSLDYAGLTSVFQDLLDKTKITATQVEDILSSIGFTPEITWEEVKYDSAIHSDQTVYGVGPDGEYIPYTTDFLQNYAGNVWIPTINGSKTSYTGSPKATAKSTAAGGSGNTSPAKKVDRTKKTDVVERYKEIEDSIDDLNNTLEDINKQADRLYGASRLALMKKANALIEDEIDLLKEKKRQAQDYLKQDFDTLGLAAANAGVVFELDEKGNITNYTELMSALYEELAAAEHYMDTAFSTSKDQDEYQKSTVQPIQDKIKELTNTISQYEKTRELLEDLDDKIEEKFYKLQDLNYEILTYEIKFKLEINDAELKKIDYYLSKYENDVYSLAEAITELSKKKELYLSDLAQENYRYEELNKKYAAGEISLADYAEGMKTVAENTWENLEALRTYDEEMMNFYGDTLAKANKEVTKYADNMSHLDNVLDHIKNITSLAGREQDYDLMESIISSSIKMSENDLAVNKKMYDMYTDEVTKWENELAKATTEAEKEAILKNLDAALKSLQEYEEKMLTSAEDALKKYTELYENNLARISYEFEKLATGGDNFDILQNKMNSLSEHADEFLTDTNKIYETEKMIRSIDKEIGSTSNSAAQQKLKAFRQQTQELQNQGELSQFELDIQLAKYDLLLAEIALEESRNSKTTMRLARDAMGNYSYVYTADAEKVADAEQKVSDAQNKLYNTRLNGANKYGEQLASIRQQWVEAIEGLDRNDKDYYEKRDALNEYYTLKMRDASHLYAISTGEDASIAAESWISSTLVQLGSMEDFTSDMATHLSNMDQEWNTYQENIDSVTESVGMDLNDIEQKIKDLTDKHEDLKDKLIDEVIPALDNEITKVGEVSAAWATLRQGLIDTITEYENLGNAAVDAYTKIASIPDTSGEGENPKDNTDLSGNTSNYNPNNIDNSQGEEPSSIWKLNSFGTLSLSNYIDNESSLLVKAYNKEGTNYGGHESQKSWGKAGQIWDIEALASGEYEIDGYKEELITIDGKKHRLYHLNKPIVLTRTHEGGTDGYSTYWINQTDLNLLLGEDAAEKLYEKYNLLPMATGGYTGAWGPGGKLAVLHEKELVLNKQDTENLLKVIDIIRANKLIDAQVAQLLHDYTTALLEHELTKMSALFDEFIERQEEAPKEVNIYADFPGVSSAVEIEAALRNLANDAAQYSGINWN